ncbi:MAG: peptidoglycan DD-metalloendopeptidase family protein [Alphaproteobacteria bacterium]|nr:peptidoglycan DD-metalloendopeptidase family protein [Alphaproteobacteria bacterium]
MIKCYKFFITIVLLGIGLNACDLQPKIVSIPDSVGMFIEDRYPALLADPETQPEIYNSAATDYGVYASPELYGSSNINDYVLYASVDDYVLVPTDEENKKSEISETKIAKEESEYIIVPMYGGPQSSIIDNKPKEDNTKDFVIVAKGDTLYSLARKNNMNVSEIAKINNLKEPYALSVGQKLKLKESADKKEPVLISQEKAQEIQKSKEEKNIVKSEHKPTTTRVGVQEIVVEKGDTLYSISRKYEIPVNDLAVMNKLSAPFNLSVGQKLKVPQLSNVKVAKVEEKKITPSAKQSGAKSDTIVNQNNVAKQNVKETKKISSDPSKQLPKITSRSSSKFSWPVRGKILSQYGPKKAGLVNDGINISAPMWTPVKAAENGVVAYAGNEVKGMGNLIIIQHSDGWMSVYAHLDSMNVKRGTKVMVGQNIGKIGMTGKVDSPQLHFEIRKGTKSYNPIQYLKK